MIVCLGWGSLIWDPRCLPVNGAWNNDGPKLPVEFVRQSKNGRLTLVIDPDSPPTQVLWSVLSVADLSEAVEALCCREGTPTDRIGRWPSHSPYECADIIERWARSRDFGGVVWTALRPKFGGQDGSRPTQTQAVDYLASLPERHRRRCAEEYVRRAPSQIDTPYRREIVERLGWTPTDESRDNR